MRSWMRREQIELADQHEAEGAAKRP
jgi:hypothetical protein